MIIGEKLRQIREAKKLSQGDIEVRTGLLRCYTSRVENGHTIPAIETLQKYANALEVPLYKFFYDNEVPPRPPKLPAPSSDAEWGQKRKEHAELNRFIKLLSRMDDRERELLLTVASRMARRSSRGSERTS